MHRSPPSNRVPRSGPALVATLLFASFAVLLLPGCYYGHLASGQLRLVLGRDSVDDVVADPATPLHVREQLALVDTARGYAAELGLDVGGRYTSYVAWPGDRVITIVVATRPGEVEAAGFHFPLVGRVPYKGFFEIESAEHEAERLRADGLDVCVLPVRAYSTLGWFDDPLTTPMLEQPGDARIIEQARACWEGHARGGGPIIIHDFKSDPLIEKPLAGVPVTSGPWKGKELTG